MVHTQQLNLVIKGKIPLVRVTNPSVAFGLKCVGDLLPDS